MLNNNRLYLTFEAKRLNNTKLANYNYQKSVYQFFFEHCKIKPSNKFFFKAALQNFESEKSLAWDYYYNELQETIKRLEEDRHNVEINWGEGGEWGSRSRSRSRRKAVTVSGPYIVYMLKPQDIMEDWTLIRKALKRSSWIISILCK